MGYFDLPSRWVSVYFQDGLMLSVCNTDTFSNAEAQETADEWTNSTKGKQHGKVVRVDFHDRNGKLLKLWLLGDNGKMLRDPVY